KKDQVSLFGQTIYKHANTKLINLYGPTEATVDVSCYECNFDQIPDSIPIGKPIDNIRLYVLDLYGQPVPIGTPGELHIAGVGLARGYINREELTRQKFIDSPLERENRLYKTGDLAMWQPDGNIAFLGRIDNQVKIRGFRIELGDIENQLLTHEKISEASVLTKKLSGEDELVAYYISEVSLEVSELRNFLAIKLPDYMVPAYFVQLEEMPLTVNGKLNRKALPNPEIKADENFELPVNELQKQLVDIWAEVLDLQADVIGIHSNFFDIGGNSLKLINVVNKINRAFDTTLTVAEIFGFPIISRIAEHMSKGEEEEIIDFDNELDQMDETIGLLNQIKG
ncbi:MAG: non-ribosomal peptide synthetase, partial [Bacteroidota bacterium]